MFLSLHCYIVFSPFLSASFFWWYVRVCLMTLLPLTSYVRSDRDTCLFSRWARNPSSRTPSPSTHSCHESYSESFWRSSKRLQDSRPEEAPSDKASQSSGRLWRGSWDPREAGNPKFERQFPMGESCRRGIRTSRSQSNSRHNRSLQSAEPLSGFSSSEGCSEYPSRSCIRWVSCSRSPRTLCPWSSKA